VFDAETKEYSAKVGEGTANFTFNLTNVSSSEVLVNRVSTSCGCTVAKLPEQPWHLAAGTNGPINVTVDLHGKSGLIMKTVTVDSTAGIKSLMVKVNIPPPQLIPVASTNGMDRTRNLELAKADRQAVFKADCAECHVKPAIGKLGKELYAGACAVCHDAEHRATMVPDLHVLKHPDTREYWTQITSEGKINSLMPAFAFKNGGILNDQQIASLVDYLVTDFAKDAPTAPHASNVPAAAGPGNASSTLGPFPVK
jgi:mono/diheme cytochrome c family protein